MPTHFPSFHPLFRLSQRIRRINSVALLSAAFSQRKSPRLCNMRNVAQDASKGRAAITDDTDMRCRTHAKGHNTARETNHPRFKYTQPMQNKLHFNLISQLGFSGCTDNEQVGYGTPTAHSSVKGQVTDSKGNLIASIRITPVEYRIYRIPDELFIPNEELFTPRSITLSQSIPTNRDNTKSERNVAVTVPFTWSAKRKISTERRTEAHSLHTGQRQKSHLPIGQGAKAGSTFIKNRPTIG